MAVHTHKSLRIGFIGFGNMAQGIAKGLIHTDALEPSRLYASAKTWDKLLANTSGLGMNACPSNKELIDAVDVVIIATKPPMIEGALEGMLDAFAGKIVLSVAAGVPFSKLSEIFPHEAQIISMVPNLAVEYGEGIFLAESENSLSAETKQMLFDIMGKLGLVKEIPTDLLNIAVAIAGSAPAFVSLFAEALADAGTYYGLSRPDAYQLAAQMITGAGKTMTESGLHPAVIKDKVCSPKGTTIAGITELEKAGFRNAVIEATKAVHSRF